MVLGLFLGLISWIGSPQSKVQLFGLGLIQFHSVAISKCLIFFFFLFDYINFYKTLLFFSFFFNYFFIILFSLIFILFFCFGRREI